MRAPTELRGFEKGAMPLCRACGFYVEPHEALGLFSVEERWCERCSRCEAVPVMRECYRRGFNAGLAALYAATATAASSLRKSSS